MIVTNSSAYVLWNYIITQILLMQVLILEKSEIDYPILIIDL